MNKNKMFFVVVLVVLVVSFFVYVVIDYICMCYFIVLFYGLFGFKSVGLVDYWYVIVLVLEKDGVKVFVILQLLVNSNEVCGEQLLVQVEEVLVLIGVEKVNLIGYSQGGMIVCYVVGVVL